MKPKNNGHGGARKGAGRKSPFSEPTITVTIKLPSSVKAQLQAITKERGITIGKFVESAIVKAREGSF